MSSFLFVILKLKIQRTYLLRKGSSSLWKTVFITDYVHFLHNNTCTRYTSNWWHLTSIYIYITFFEAFNTQFNVTVGHPVIKQHSIQIVAKLCCLIVGLAVSENTTKVLLVIPFAHLEHCPRWIWFPAPHAKRKLYKTRLLQKEHIRERE